MHVRGIEDNPISMWKALKEVHMQQKPTARFNAYEALFSITKSNDELLPAVAARVEKAMHTIKDLEDTCNGVPLVQSDPCILIIGKALVQHLYH